MTNVHTAITESIKGCGQDEHVNSPSMLLSETPTPTEQFMPLAELFGSASERSVLSSTGCLYSAPSECRGQAAASSDLCRIAQQFNEKKRDKGTRAVNERVHRQRNSNAYEALLPTSPQNRNAAESPGIPSDK